MVIVFCRLLVGIWGLCFSGFGWFDYAGSLDLVDCWIVVCGFGLVLWFGDLVVSFGLIWMMGLVIWVLLWADLLVSCRFDIIYVPGLLVCCYGYCVGCVLGLPIVD